MKAKVTVRFKALRPGDKKNSWIESGEIVEDGLAAWAIHNGHGRQVADDTPMGKPEAKAAPAPAKTGKGGKQDKKKPEQAADAGGDGDDDQGDGGGE